MNELVAFLCLFVECNIFLYMFANLGEILFHAFRVLVVDDIEQFLQLVAYLRNLVVGVGVEEDFLQ